MPVTAAGGRQTHREMAQGSLDVCIDALALALRRVLSLDAPSASPGSLLADSDVAAARGWFERAAAAGRPDAGNNLWELPEQDHAEQPPD